VTPTELELIAVRDAEAMARFYDRHVAGVRHFCAAVCPAERVEEAVESAIVNFLARATEKPTHAAPEDLLRSATREVAAGRMKPEVAALSDPADPVCRAMPELVAAHINGELRGSGDLVEEHLRSCSVCQGSAARLEQAEVAFVAWPTVVREIRDTSLRLAVSPTESAVATHAPPASQPQASPERPVRVRARRGGLVGAVRQLARSRGANQGSSVTDVAKPRP
jgi:hypothetical protein